MEVPWKIAYDNFQREFVLYAGSPRMMQADTQLVLQQLTEELNRLRPPNFVLSAALNTLFFLGYIAGCVLLFLFIIWPFDVIFSILYIVAWMLLSDIAYIGFRRGVARAIRERQSAIFATHRFFHRSVVVYARKIYFEMVFVPHNAQRQFNYVLPPNGEARPATAAPIPEIHLTPVAIGGFALQAADKELSAYKPPRDVPLYGNGNVSVPQSELKAEASELRPKEEAKEKGAAGNAVKDIEAIGVKAAGEGSKALEGYEWKRLGRSKSKAAKDKSLEGMERTELSPLNDAREQNPFAYEMSENEKLIVNIK